MSQPGKERAAIGPGLVFALSVVGAGDYVSNAAIGATYGTALLWVLLLAAACRYVWVEACARYVLVTGETPFQGFARISPALVWLVLVTLIVHRHVHGLYHVLFMGSSIHALIPLPVASSAAVWSIFFVGAGYAMICWPGYKLVERFFKILMAVMGGALIVVVVMAPPSIGAIFRGLFIPSIPDVQGPYSSTLLLTALIGTEACSLSNITYSYFMWQKGWRDISYQARQRTDLLFGIGAMFFMGCFLQIAAAGSLGGQVPSNVDDLIRLFSARLGVVGHVAFCVGIWAAVFTSFVGGISGYSMVIVDVIRTFVLREGSGRAASRTELQRDPIYRVLVALFCFSPLYILYSHVRPVGLVLVGSAGSVLVVPFISMALLRLTSSQKIMGDQRNHWINSGVLVVLVIVSCYLIYRNAVELWAKYG